MTVDPVGPLPPTGARRSSPTAGWRACLIGSRSCSAASRRRSRSAPATASSPPPGGRRTSPTRRLARSARDRVPVPDPGVRAVHVPDGHLCGAGGRVLRLPARRPVLDRAAARLLPPPPDRRVRDRRRRRRRRRRRFRTRSPPSTRRPRRSCASAARAGSCSTPGPSRTRPATCSSSGVLALSRALAEGAFTGGWELHGIGTVRARPPDRRSAAAPRWSCCPAPTRPPTGTCCATTMSGWR